MKYTHLILKKSEKGNTEHTEKQTTNIKILDGKSVILVTTLNVSGKHLPIKTIKSQWSN